jgi:hypothetical protein
MNLHYIGNFKLCEFGRGEVITENLNNGYGSVNIRRVVHDIKYKETRKVMYLIIFFAAVIS